jgi:hypothetical protein
MFAKDFNLLNEIYLKKVNEMNIGPQGDNQDVTPSPVRIKTIIPPEKHCSCEDDEEENCEGRVNDESESNGEMSRQLLYRIHKLSGMLHDILNGKNNIEAWVLSKITNAHDQLDSVFGYEDYKSIKEPMNGVCNDNLEENNEEDLYKAISNGGNNIINQIQSILKKESRETLEKVLFETIVLLEKK